MAIWKQALAIVLFGCAPEPCTPADLASGEMKKLADDCQARVRRDCGHPPKEDCPTLVECDQLGERWCDQ